MDLDNSTGSNDLLNIFFTIIMSIIIIYGIQLLWNYLKDTYSTKKTKDLVNTQIQKYKMMIGEQAMLHPLPSVVFTDLEKQSMDDELTEFIQNA